MEMASSLKTMPGRSCGDTWPSLTDCSRSKLEAGDVFADTQLNEGLHSIVDKDVTTKERRATSSSSSTRLFLTTVSLTCLDRRV